MEIWGLGSLFCLRTTEVYVVVVELKSAVTRWVTLFLSEAQAQICKTHRQKARTPVTHFHSSPFLAHRRHSPVNSLLQYEYTSVTYSPLTHVDIKAKDEYICFIMNHTRRICASNLAVSRPALHSGKTDKIQLDSTALSNLCDLARILTSKSFLMAGISCLRRCPL